MHRGLRRVIIVSFVLALIAPVLLSAPAALAVEPQPFSNGFETDMIGWDGGTRVSSGTDNITSAGGSWHAKATAGEDPFTQWGGYTDEFPFRGYITRVDIYLDVDGSWANDTRFDWDVASNRSTGQHLRDFAFNGGFYNDDDATGDGPRFVFTASNNTGRPNAWPKNPARNPVPIETSGWYTFEHRFYNDNGALAVDLTIYDASGEDVGSWTLTNPADTIADVVGGNRYGWFASNELSTLAFDNSELVLTEAATHFVDDDGMADAVSCDAGTDTHETIQEAIDAVSAGDTIMVCPGIYAEQVVVGKHVVLDGTGSGTESAVDTIIQGAGTGDGISLTAGGASVDDRLVIRDLRVQGFNRGINTDSTISYVALSNIVATDNAAYGIEIHNHAVVHDLTMDAVFASNNSVGMRVRGEVTNLDINGGGFNNNGQGFLSVTASGEVKPFSSVDVSGTTFNNNTLKGIYLEKIDSATFTNIQVNSSGTSGSSSAGIDINLKYDDFANIAIVDSEVTNSGAGNPNDGVGLAIKARDDGSYAANPATLTNVDIFNNLFSGNQNGIRIGEPGKNNAGPTDLEIDDSDIAGNLGFGVENVSQTLVDATCNWWGAVDGPSGVASGSGEAVSDNVLFFPWHTESNGSECEGAGETPPEVVTCLNSLTGGMREVDDPSDCGRRETALVLDNTGADGGKIFACLNKYNHRMRIVDAGVNCQPHETFVAWNQGTGDDPQIHACVNPYTGYFRIIPSASNCSARSGYLLSWDNPSSPPQFPPRSGTSSR